MSTRRAKQLIYGTLYIVIALMFCGALYLLIRYQFTGAPVAVCTPSSCAPTSTAPISAGKVWTFVTSPGHFTFLAQAINQNTDFGASTLDYEINLYDTSGTVVQSIPASSFIYPTQSKYFAVLNQSVSSPFDYASLVFTDASWLPSSTIGTIPSVAPGQFAVQNVQSSIASTTVSVSGQIVNTSVVSYGQVLILVIFNDPDGNPIGVSQTELNDVGAGATNNFSVIYPAETNINPALNQVIVYALRS